VNLETILHRKISFKDLESVQSSLVERSRKDSAQGFVLISEPSPTFSCGVSGKPNEVLFSDSQRAEFGIDSFKVRRGGKWTYHGPGQILLYPILNLKNLGLGTKNSETFMTLITEATLNFLKTIKIPAIVRREPYGIYVGDAKLVSFGLGISRGITMHGTALYVEDQRAFFNGIIPCGVATALISLRELGVSESWETLAKQWAFEVEKAFNLTKKLLT